MVASYDHHRKVRNPLEMEMKENAAYGPEMPSSQQPTDPEMPSQQPTDPQPTMEENV